MFDLGFQELVVIFVVALLVFGPKRLPELARNMGKGIAQLRKAMMDVKSEVEKEAEEATGGAKEALKHDLPSWKDKAVRDILGTGAPPAGADSPREAGGQGGGAQPTEEKSGDPEKS